MDYHGGPQSDQLQTMTYDSPVKRSMAFQAYQDTPLQPMTERSPNGPGKSHQVQRRDSRITRSIEVTNVKRNSNLE